MVYHHCTLLVHGLIHLELVVVALAVSGAHKRDNEHESCIWVTCKRRRHAKERYDTIAAEGSRPQMTIVAYARHMNRIRTWQASDRTRKPRSYQAKMQRKGRLLDPVPRCGPEFASRKRAQGRAFVHRQLTAPPTTTCSHTGAR
jgi:hypothetical protein